MIIIFLFIILFSLSPRMPYSFDNKPLEFIKPMKRRFHHSKRAMKCPLLGKKR